MDFDAWSHSVDGTEHVTVTGELDLASATALEEVLRGISRRHVVVDASALTFVDVVGLSALLRCHEALTAAGGTLVVRNPPSIFRLVLEALSLQNAVPVDDT